MCVDRKYNGNIPPDETRIAPLSLGKQNLDERVVRGEGRKSQNLQRTLFQYIGREATRETHNNRAYMVLAMVIEA